MIIILLSTPTILPFQKYKQIVKKILPSKREQVFLEWSFGLQFIKVDFVTGYQEIRIVFLETFWITKTCFLVIVPWREIQHQQRW